MKFQNGEIIRYIQVNFGFDTSPWYIDLDDEIEKGDMVLVPYRYQEREGVVTHVVRCVYPYVIFPAEKTKLVFEVTRKAEQ